MPHLKIFLPLIFCLSANILAAQMPQGLMFPNGFPLKKGQAYYQNCDLAFNGFTIGATDNLSVGLGTIPTFLFEEGYWMYTISAKIAATSLTKKISAGLGFFHWGATYFDAPSEYENYLLAPYGVVTFGTPQKNVSVLGGAFYGMTYFGNFNGRLPHHFEHDEDLNDYPNPMFGFSAHQKGRGRLAFVFDSYYFKDCCDHILILAPGGRIYGRRDAFDFSVPIVFYGVGDDPEIFPVPWLSLFVGLGKKSRPLFQN